MNNIVNSLSFIADAAEYFDKKTGAAWKIRSMITNSLVWSANSYLYAEQSGDAQRTAQSAIQLATLRVWAEDCNTSSFVLDLTPSAVRRTLGLERVVDVHEEACREARMKCIQTRSATNFKKYYDSAINAFEERRIQREENVERIANLLSDRSFDFEDRPDVIDALSTYHDVHVVEYTKGKVGDPMTCTKVVFADKDLYDEASVERQGDTLAECVGNALEAMYDVCDNELAAAITTNKVQRLTGFHRAIMQMMEIAGVDTKKLAERRAKLEALIDAQINTVSSSVQDIDAQIAAQVAEMAVPAPAEEPAKPKRTRVAKAA